MTIPPELQPTSSPRVIDLVAAAGLDISDWSKFKGGEKKAASNPKYCYEWAFQDQGKVIILNLWYDSLKEEFGEIFQELNYKEYARELAKAKIHETRIKRSKAMDSALAAAYSRALPVRVIICNGTMVNAINNPEKSSRVKHRTLDPVPWAVTSYDPSTGKCKITRGKQPLQFADQFSTEFSDERPIRRTISGEVIVRNPEVRRSVLARARGYCEFCSQPGFITRNGSAYLETHHIIPLSGNGSDIKENVIALCPNDHRIAHYSLQSSDYRARFQTIVKAKN